MGTVSMGQMINGIYKECAVFAIIMQNLKLPYTNYLPTKVFPGQIKEVYDLTVQLVFLGTHNTQPYQTWPHQRGDLSIEDAYIVWNATWTL